MHERNIDGIKTSAHKRTEKKVEAAMAAIESLLKRGIQINFESVAAEASCSRAFLYNHLAIRERIDRLREDTTNGVQKAPPESRMTESSRDTVIQGMRKKIERLNDDLKAERKESMELRTALEKALGEAEHWRNVHLDMMVRYEK